MVQALGNRLCASLWLDIVISWHAHMKWSAWNLQLQRKCCSAEVDVHTHYFIILDTDHADHDGSTLSFPHRLMWDAVHGPPFYHSDPMRTKTVRNTRYLGTIRPFPYFKYKYISLDRVVLCILQPSSMPTFNYQADVLITSVINVEECDAYPYFFDLLQCLHRGDFHAYEFSYHFTNGTASYMCVKVCRVSSNFWSYFSWECFNLKIVVVEIAGRQP